MDRRKGGIYGLLVGDALGVPYEFHSADEIPDYDNIEMIPPEGYPRSYAEVQPGTWSDDGAQALALLDSLVTIGRFDLDDFSKKLLSWYTQGAYAVDNKVFDIGVQTADSLSAYADGTPAKISGLSNPNGKGNGALMRVLPLALWHKGSDKELVDDAHAQSLVTHGHILNQVLSALYCLVNRELLTNSYFGDAYTVGVAKLRRIYKNMPNYQAELDAFCPDEPLVGRGSGFISDSLRSAFMVVSESDNYEDTVKRAIMLGNDTDTTACIAGGTAGLMYGVEKIPERWIAQLRGKEFVDEILKRWD